MGRPRALIGGIGLTAIVVLAVTQMYGMSNSASGRSAQASDCSTSTTAMSKSEAETLALNEAARHSFANATVEVSELLSLSELEATTRIGIGSPEGVDCVWHVDMSGTKVEDRFAAFVPTPITPITYTVMEMAFEANEGLNRGRIFAVKAYATNTPGGPTPTATSVPQNTPTP